MDDDEFEDDIDWGSIDLPTVTPGKKKMSPSSSKPPSLQQCLEMAEVYAIGDDKEDEDEAKDEVGDELQLKAIELANDGKNLFLTGKAGTGKSWATKRIVSSFYNDEKIIHATAPTGIAAINVGGQTINHWGRFQLGQYYEDFNNMFSEETRKKIRKMDALLIDEISMLDGHLFDVIECMVTIIRCYDEVKERLARIRDGDSIMNEAMLKLRWETTSENGLGDLLPFGGLQLIIVGDFYQLPPVANQVEEVMQHGNPSACDFKIGRQGSYAFESNAWRHSSFHTVELKEVHRQDDSELFEFLNDMREGSLDVSKHASTLAALQTPLPIRNDGIIPTELHSKNYVVDNVNKRELEKLPDKIHESVSLDEVELSPEYIRSILAIHGLQDLAGAMTVKHMLEIRALPRHVEAQVRNELKEFNLFCQEHFFERDCRVAHKIELKKEAQVMLRWNLHFKSKLANGSRGVIKGFFPAKGYYHLIQEVIAERQEDGSDIDDQVSKPLAISNDKDTSSHALVTPSKFSQEESASSARNKSIAYDFSGINPQLVKDVKGHLQSLGSTIISRELEHMAKVVQSGTMDELPTVQFTNGKQRVIRPQPFSKEFKGVGTATRWQVPISLAWAISIHKSQGLTIECLHIDLTDCFAIGQAYVACSRGRCLNSMTLRNFKQSEVKTSTKVTTFYNSVNNGKVYPGKTWMDTIADFDAAAMKESEEKKTMKQHYDNSEKCECGATCITAKILRPGPNQGKFFLSCSAADQGDHGHTWKMVNRLPLISGNDNEHDNQSHSADTGIQQSKLLTPGLDGAKKGRLKDVRFVATGLFPELGGGEGLKLGRDNLKLMIESFGGKVTGSISGKTNMVVYGIEPGVKQLEKARTKGVPAIDRFTLHKILMGEEELPSIDISQPPTKKQKKDLEEL